MKRLYKHGFLIKVLAVTTMVIDHIGSVFFPQLLILRIIGRLSFPLFGYLVSEGFDRTHNKKIYLLRMLSFFLISQVPYTLAFANHQLNIFITLLLGIVIIWIIENKTLDTFKKLSFVFFLLFVGFILPLDYGIAGIISIVLFHVFKHSYSKLLGAQTLLWTSYIGMFYINGFLGGKIFQYPNDGIQVFAPLSVVIVWVLHSHYSNKDFWNISKKGKAIIQYGFYAFYPIHLLVLHLIAYAK